MNNTSTHQDAHHNAHHGSNQSALSYQSSMNTTTIGGTASSPAQPSQSVQQNQSTSKNSYQIDMRCVNLELHMLHHAKENKHISSKYIIRIVGEDGIPVGCSIRYISKCPQKQFFDHVHWCEGKVIKESESGIIIESEFPIPITLPIGKPVAVLIERKAPP